MLEAIFRKLPNILHLLPDFLFQAGIKCKYLIDKALLYCFEHLQSNDVCDKSRTLKVSFLTQERRSSNPITYRTQVSSTQEVFGYQQLKRLWLSGRESFIALTSPMYKKFVNKDITQFKTIFRPFGMRIF